MQDLFFTLMFGSNNWKKHCIWSGVILYESKLCMKHFLYIKRNELSNFKVMFNVRNM
jgi:hypothetical protein